jgi:hypothetical protein
MSTSETKRDAGLRQLALENRRPPNATDYSPGESSTRLIAGNLGNLPKTGAQTPNVKLASDEFVALAESWHYNPAARQVSLHVQSRHQLS